MFYCATCRKTVFLPECPGCGCGSVEPEADDIAGEFFEFIRASECPEPEREPPEPFRRRLATFVQRDESDVMLDHPKQSTMPLRIFAPLGPYIGPKSSWLIRKILKRIQYLVHGKS